MNRVATCPTCKTSYELDDEDIGHLMECECGEVLFACHTRSLPAFPIHCQHCGGEHQVGGRDAGKTVAVDCGASVVVPGVTLRAPIGTRETATKFQATVDRDGMVAKTDDKPETQEVPGHAAGHAAGHPAGAPAHGHALLGGGRAGLISWLLSILADRFSRFAGQWR